MKSKRKHQILAKQMHLVSRPRLVEESDYRWWRYVDEEPASGFVDTSYLTKDFPYARTPKVSTRAPKKTSLSKTQLRRRLAHAGVRFEKIASVASLALNYDLFKIDPKGKGRSPLLVSLEEVVGPRVARRVMKDVRPPIMILDEAWYLLSSPEMTKLMESCRSYPGTLSLNPFDQPMQLAEEAV